MATPCRRDCAYYSTYTETCDYTLINYRARPCPTAKCTEYKKRGEGRSWQVFRDTTLPSSAARTAGTAPRRFGGASGEERYSTAECGHEVFPGERTYATKDGRRLCPDCVEERFNSLSTAEKACLLGYELSQVV